MSFKPLYILLLVISILVAGLKKHENYDSYNFKLITEQKNYTAGDSITLEFSNYKGSSDVFLYCSNSYGSILIYPQSNKNLYFKIPESISNKSGTLNWELHSENNVTSGQIKVLPKNTIMNIESYVGPPSIEAGGTDFTMFVAIPTDDLDNPLVDSTKVTIKHLFLDTQKNDEILTKHGFAYKNLYSYEKSGRMLLNSECLALNSKELDVSIMPAIPTNFDITSNRIHNFADGNQITTLKTSVIKDRYNNIVSDGTFVTFFITNQIGNKITTNGSTINGVATAKILHPDYEDKWIIKAYIEGIAESNSLELNYNQAILDYDVLFSDNNRTISVGPLKSFMSQFIPDGFNVELRIYKNNKLENLIVEESKDGFAIFKLNKDRYKKGVYSIEVKTAGIVKKFPNLDYEL